MVLGNACVDTEITSDLLPRKLFQKGHLEIGDIGRYCSG
jgi:hypothetical protein